MILKNNFSYLVRAKCSGGQNILHKIAMGGHTEVIYTLTSRDICREILYFYLFYIDNPKYEKKI